MSPVEQPLLGSLLQQLREQAAPGGKKMSRVKFAELLGMTPTQIHNIEHGRKLKSGELEKIAAVYPQLETGEVQGLLIQDVRLTGTATGQSTSNSSTVATQWTGQCCIQCQAAYRDDGTVTHKRECPSSLPPGEATVDFVQSADKPYCACTDRNTGWTNRGDGQWVCGNCGKLSKMVYEQRQAQSTVHGDLVALDEELEDPEAQEVTIEQQLSLGWTDEALSVTDEVGKPCPSGVYAERPTLYFSNSEIQTFKQCRRKWYLTWYRQLRLKAQDPVGPLAIGNRVHRALQAWYVPEGETPTDPRTALEAAISSDWQACMQAYRDRGVEPSQDLVTKFNQDTSLERAMVEGYIGWLHETAVDRGLRVVAPETYIEAPLDVPGSDVDVKLIGKIDVRVVREIDGARLFIDHKTTASLTEPLKTIRLDPQMLHYHVLEWLSDVESSRCDGALYNMLKKVKRTARANPPFFDRVEVRHNIHELEAFKKQLTGVIRSILDIRARLDAGEDPAVIAYPTPTRDCGWKCDFLPVCPMHDDGSRVEHAIEQYYEVGDPHSYYREKEE